MAGVNRGPGASSTVVGAEVALNVVQRDASGNIVIPTGGSGGTAQADDSAFTVGTTSVTPIAGLFDDVSPDAVTEDHVAAVRITEDRALHVHVASGGTAGVQYTEADTDTTITGTAALAEGPSNTLTPLQLDASGQLKVVLPAGASGLTDAELRASAIEVDGSGVTQPVSAASLPLPTGAATSANQTTMIGHLDGVEGILTTMDADTGNIALGTGATSDAAATAGSTGSINAKLRLATSQLDSIKTAVETLDNAIAGSEMQVDVVTSALPSGAATSAKQDTVIGHLDGVEALLTTIDADTSNLSVVGGGTEAAAIRVTIANNSTGVLSVDDNGSTISIDDGAGSITVDGTVAVTGVSTSAKQDTIIGHLDGVEGFLATIDGNASTIAGAVAGSEMQVDVVAALPAGNNNIGDVDVASLPALATGSNVIGRTGHDITGIGHGNKTVTTAGTDVALAASTSCKRVVIQALTSNTNYVAIGGSGVDATLGSGSGILLQSGEVFELEIDNLADVFVDSLVNGEGVRYTYFT